MSEPEKPRFSLGRNIIANYVGRAWPNVLGILLIPLYLRFLGMESYGLVGFSATLAGVLGLLDLGIGFTLNRELARLSTADASAVTQRDLVRTLETLYWGIAVLGGALVVCLAPVIASDWVKAQKLPPSTVIAALRLMGVAVALQFPFSLYQGALMGLQRQVLVNVILVLTGTLRGVGAVVVLWLVSPTIQAFLVWQVIAGLVGSAALLIALWRCLPSSAAPARFRLDLLRGIWRFAASMSANALIGVVLTQLDKVILSRMLTLERFGYYTLAATVASAIWSLIVPFNSAVFPRLVQLHEHRSEPELRVLFHRTSQLLSAMLLPVCALLIVFSKDILLLWTRNPEVVENCHLILSCLVLGTMLNGIVSVPCSAAAAFGWPQLITYANLIQAIAIVPLMVSLVLWLGGLGAALAWMVLNCGYVAFLIPCFFRRYLTAQEWEWSLRDQGIPILVSFSICLTASWLAPASLPPVARFGYLAVTFLLTLSATAWSLGHVRDLVTSTWRKHLQR